MNDAELPLTVDEVREAIEEPISDLIHWLFKNRARVPHDLLSSLVPLYEALDAASWDLQYNDVDAIDWGST